MGKRNSDKAIRKAIDRYVREVAAIERSSGGSKGSLVREIVKDLPREYKRFVPKDVLATDKRTRGERRQNRKARTMGP